MPKKIVTWIDLESSSDDSSSEVTDTKSLPRVIREKDEFTVLQARIQKLELNNRKSGYPKEVANKNASFYKLQFPQAGNQGNFPQQNQRFWNKTSGRQVAYRYDKPYFHKKYVNPYDPNFVRKKYISIMPTEVPNYRPNQNKRPNFRQFTRDSTATFSSRQEHGPQNGNWDGRTNRNDFHNQSRGHANYRRSSQPQNSSNSDSPLRLAGNHAVYNCSSSDPLNTGEQYKIVRGLFTVERLTDLANRTQRLIPKLLPQVTIAIDNWKMDSVVYTGFGTITNSE